MVLAHPINSKGVQTGAVKKFSDLQWERMVATFKSGLAWKKVPEENTHKKQPFVELIREGKKRKRVNQNKKPNE